MSNKKFQSDAEYVSGILKDDREAVTLLYQEHYDMVERLILKNSGDSNDAKDIYQDGFVILVRNIKKGLFRSESTIKTYLYSICRRLWLKLLNERSKIMAKVVDREDFEIIDEKEENDADEYLTNISRMRKGLEALGEPCRTIIMDFYMNKLSMQAIQEKMGYTSASNAKNQKYKCLQRLKKLFFK